MIFWKNYKKDRQAYSDKAHAYLYCIWCVTFYKPFQLLESLLMFGYFKTGDCRKKLLLLQFYLILAPNRNYPFLLNFIFNYCLFIYSSTSIVLIHKHLFCCFVMIYPPVLFLFSNLCSIINLLILDYYLFIQPLALF